MFPSPRAGQTHERGVADKRTQATAGGHQCVRTTRTQDIEHEDSTAVAYAGVAGLSAWRAAKRARHARRAVRVRDPLLRTCLHARQAKTKLASTLWCHCASLRIPETGVSLPAGSRARADHDLGSDRIVVPLCRKKKKKPLVKLKRKRRDVIPVDGGGNRLITQPNVSRCTRSGPPTSRWTDIG